MRHKAQQPVIDQGVDRRRLVAHIAIGAAIAGLATGCSVLGFENEEDKRQRALVKQMNEALKPLGARVGDPVFMRLFKLEAVLELWVQPRARGDFVKFKDFPICKFSGKLGPKQHEGDHQAPEGFYTVTADQLNPNSQYHRSFNLGFPNAFDQQHGRTGSYLMVHGGCVSVGCYAMTDDGIDQIYAMADGYLNAPRNGRDSALRYFFVHAFPFVPTQEKMAQMQAAGAPWVPFWMDLWQGYKAFNVTKQPPRIGIKDRRYVVTPRALSSGKSP